MIWKGVKPMHRRFLLLLAIVSLSFHAYAKSTEEPKERPWQNSKLTLREKVELYRKLVLKETKTVLSNKRFEVELTENVPKDGAIWDSWPVQATVWDNNYYYKYSVSLTGSKVEKAQLFGQYLYAEMFYLGSSYPSGSLDAVNLHSWGQATVIEDIADGEYSPDGRWFIYEPYMGKFVENAADEIDLARLGDNFFSVVNLTGQNRLNVFGHDNDIGGDTPVWKPIQWPKNIARTKTWKRRSRFIWGANSQSVFFVVGERGSIGKEEDMVFPLLSLVKLELPPMATEDTGNSMALEKWEFPFKVKSLPFRTFGYKDEVVLTDKSTVRLSKKGGKPILVSDKDFERTVNAEVKKLNQDDFKGDR